MNSTEYEAWKVHFLEQAKKEKDWLLDTKSNFCVNMGSMEVSESIDTEPMIIVIKEAVGFKFPAEQFQAKKSWVSMIHSLSLYDNEEKRFFGWTYTSMEKKVRSTLNGTEGEEYIFIHLPKGYTMNDTQVYCVHESYLKVTDTVGLGDEFQCVGYGFFKLFNHKAETRKSRIYRGTPRDLIMNPDLTKYVP